MSTVTNVICSDAPQIFTTLVQMFAAIVFLCTMEWKLAALLDRLGVDYVCGKTWTTDAFYRETESNTARRVGEGCVCVEMECSALQAVCDFRGAALYQFVYAADSLHGTWNRRILGELEKDARLQYFGLAWEIVKALESEE